MYLLLRHRTWWAMHTIPASLRAAMGNRARLSKSLGTSDKKEAERRAQALWLHSWSKRLDEARMGSPSHTERDAAFYRDLLREAESSDDRLIYVNNVIKGKLLESGKLGQQALNNTKEQFSNSPDLMPKLNDALMDALDAHQNMSRQALASEEIRREILEILLGPGQLYEALRNKAHEAAHE